MTSVDPCVELPSASESAAAFMTGLRGSLEDLDRALNRGGGLKRIKEVVAQCHKDSAALQAVRDELDYETVENCLAELKDYEARAITVAKKYYDDGIETVEDLLGIGAAGPAPAPPGASEQDVGVQGARSGGPPPRRGGGRRGQGGGPAGPANPTPRTPANSGGALSHLWVKPNDHRNRELGITRKDPRRKGGKDTPLPRGGHCQGMILIQREVEVQERPPEVGPQLEVGAEMD